MIEPGPSPALLVRLRPAGPWRIGPPDGSRDSVDRILHSDTLFSTVSRAMGSLECLDEWLADTVRAEAPAVRFTSAFPFLGDLLYVTPPRGLWPPPPSAKVRWQSAELVPLTVVQSLATQSAVDENQWWVDLASRCLLPVDRTAPGGAHPAVPFHVVVRHGAAIDRLTGVAEPHSMACIEFAPNAGMWCAAVFADNAARERWADRVKAAFRLLADSGIGGRRSQGWGRAEQPDFRDGMFPDLLWGSAAQIAGADEPLWWTLSLFSPAGSDAIDWRRGHHALLLRRGRIESSDNWGRSKKAVNMVAEGSLLASAKPPLGTARDVAPDGFPHPVFCAGFAVAVPLVIRGSAS